MNGSFCHVHISIAIISDSSSPSAICLSLSLFVACSALTSSCDYALDTLLVTETHKVVILLLWHFHLKFSKACWMYNTVYYFINFTAHDTHLSKRLTKLLRQPDFSIIIPNVILIIATQLMLRLLHWSKINLKFTFKLRSLKKPSN